ncbi:MAG: PASTA domain-containing protein, partial [Clostridium sp.]
KKSKNKNKTGNKVLKRLLTSLVGVVIIAMLAFGGFALAGGTAKEKEVKIPDITGKTVAEATEILKNLKLEMQQVDPEKSDKPEGTIIEVNPKIGTMVKENTIVKVIVSSGKEKIFMPDLKESIASDAKSKLNKLGITNIKEENIYNDSIPTGKVIETNPKLREEINEETEITLYISKGPEKVTVPNLYNLSSQEAQDQLTGLKLIPIIEKQKTNDKNFDGKVMDQSEKNKEVEVGHRITIIVGEFEAKTIDISAYLSVAKTVKDAKSILDEAGIEYNFEGPKGDLDLIRDYTKSIKEGEVVIIKTEAAPVKPPVTPPVTPPITPPITPAVTPAIKPPVTPSAGNIDGN